MNVIISVISGVASLVGSIVKIGVSVLGQLLEVLKGAIMIVISLLQSLA